MRQLELAEALGTARGAHRREQAMSHVDDNLWDRAVIDQAILFFAVSGERFSANQVRPLLPEVRRAAIGPRFMAAARRGQIVRVDWTPSSDPGTHCHQIAVWQGTGK